MWWIAVVIQTVEGQRQEGHSVRSDGPHGAFQAGEGCVETLA